MSGNAEWKQIRGMIEDLQNTIEELFDKNNELIVKLDDKEAKIAALEWKVDHLRRELEGKETAELLEIFDVEPAIV